MEALKRYNYVPNNNARNLAMNRRYRIAFVSFRSLDAAYFAPTVEEGIRQAVRDYGDHGLAVETYISSAEHPGQQAEDIRQAFDSGIRDFVIACADAEQLKPVLLRLRKQACRVILLSKYAGPDTCDTFIGADDQKSGRLAAEVLGHMIPGNGSVQILVPGSPVPISSPPDSGWKAFWPVSGHSALPSGFSRRWKPGTPRPASQRRFRTS